MSSELVENKVLFGQKAVQAAYISELELEECLALQEKIKKKKGAAPRIGEILVHKEYMTKDQVVQILRGKWQPIGGKFGEIAVALELVTAEELDRCMKVQNKMRKADRRPLPIGQIMVQEGLIRPNAIIKILSFQSKTVARCPRCGSAYNIENFRPGVYNCSVDQEVLEEVADLEGLTELADKEPSQKTIRPLAEMRRDEEFGRFKIIAKIGVNPLGDCYLAYQAERERECVLRVLDPVRTLETAYKDRLLGSVEQAIALGHTNVRRVHMVGRKRGYYYLAMEHVEGSSLRQILLEKSLLPYPQALGIVRKAAEGLRYGDSKGLRHGDLRPSNIVVGAAAQVWVLDLGVPVDPKEMFRSFRNDQEIPGFYIAPEVVLNAEEIDARADIFSLGCIFYHMLCGRPPFRGRSTVEILDKMTKLGLPPLRQGAAHTPNEACELVETMLAVESDDRPETWDAMIEALDALPKEGKKTALGSVDYSTVFVDGVKKIGDEEVENARLQSMRFKRAKKKPKKPEQEMSYSQLIESMRAGGDEEGIGRSESKRATLEEFAEKKPVGRHAPIQAERRLSSRAFWLGGLAILAVAGALGGWITLRSRSEFSRKREGMEAKAKADDDATQERVDEKERTDQLQAAFRARQIFDLEAELVRLLQEPAFGADIFQSILVYVEQVYELRGAKAKSGDLEMILGRSYLYRVMSDEFMLVDAATRQEWVSAARTHLEEAAKAYGESTGTTMVGPEVQSPDGLITRDLRLRLPDRAPERRIYPGAETPWFDPGEGVVDYGGSAEQARADVERLLAALNEYVSSLGD